MESYMKNIVYHCISYVACCYPRDLFLSNYLSRSACIASIITVLKQLSEEYKYFELGNRKMERRLKQMNKGFHSMAYVSINIQYKTSCCMAIQKFVVNTSLTKNKPIHKRVVQIHPTKTHGGLLCVLSLENILICEIIEASLYAKTKCNNPYRAVRDVTKFRLPKGLLPGFNSI